MGTVAVLGTGTMGIGIAQTASQAGREVLFWNRKPESVEKGLAALRKSLERLRDKNRISASDCADAIARMRGVSALEDLKAAELLIECVPEDLELKRELFERLASICGEAAIFASNTSSLSITGLACNSGRPDRFVGLHFFNPVPAMKLVEVVRGAETSDATIQAATQFAEALGKTAIQVRDMPGFVVNRVLIPLLNDCLRVLDEARVSPEDLDTAMTAGAGWPMGPCTLVDLVGIDVHVHASEALYEKLREPRMAPPPRIVAMRNAGLLGRKSGRGFYRYD